MSHPVTAVRPIPLPDGLELEPLRLPARVVVVRQSAKAVEAWEHFVQRNGLVAEPVQRTDYALTDREGWVPVRDFTERFGRDPGPSDIVEEREDTYFVTGHPLALDRLPLLPFVRSATYPMSERPAVRAAGAGSLSAAHRRTLGAERAERRYRAADRDRARRRAAD